MNSHFISNELYRFYHNFEYKLKNTYVFNWESDFFCVSTSGYVYEIEIKISKSDFKNDFTKRLSLKNSPLKHDYLVNDSIILRPNKFFFACQEGLINLSDIPAQYGLIWIPERGSAYYVRDAKFLHKTKLFTNHKFTTQIMNKFYYRYLEVIRSLKYMQNDIKFNQKRLHDDFYF